MLEPIIYTPDDIDAATRTVDGEARGEPVTGQVAVAWVIRTRADWDELHSAHPEHEWWGTTPAKVCEHPAQFSCWNGGADTDHIKALETTSGEYIVISGIVQDVFDGKVEDPTGGATHYKVRGTKASWDHATVGMTPREIGKHDFFCLGPTG